MYNPKISVILPVYNSEKRLKTTLDSLLNQTFKDFELIIINDASTDNSINIAKKYIEKFRLLKILNLKVNTGVSNARNLGIQNAKGEYISFIDSDDFICETFLETMYKNAIKNNADIVCCNYYISKNLYKIKNYFHLHREIYDSCKILKSLIKDVNLHFFVWNKLWKKDIIIKNNISFQGTCYEDILFCIKGFYYSKKVVVINNYLYYYSKHVSSLTAFMSFDKLNNYIKALEDVKKFFMRNNIYKLYKSSYSWLCLRFLLSCFYRIPHIYLCSRPKIGIMEFSQYVCKKIFDLIK